MAQFTITRKLSTLDNTIEAWANDIDKIMTDCVEVGAKHGSEDLKVYKKWLAKRDNKFFNNVYEGNRNWKNDHSHMLVIGKAIVSRLPEYIESHELAEYNYSDTEALKSLFIQAKETLSSLGKTCRVSSVSGTRQLMENYLDRKGQFADKPEKPEESEEGEGEDNSVQTSDKSDNRTPAEIAQNFFDIAQASQHETADILTEFAKLVKANQNTGFVDADIKIAS